VPVVVDGTGEKDAIVPDLFRAVQWTRLPQGATPPEFVERVKRLLSPEAATAIRPSASPQFGAGGTNRAPVPAVWSLKRPMLLALAALIVAAVVTQEYSVRGLRHRGVTPGEIFSAPISERRHQRSRQFAGGNTV
jgi:hypothetical protein